MSERPLTKKELIAKISKEQGVDPKSLERLNVAALLKMDAAVPDEGDLLGGSTSETPQQTVDAGTPDAGNVQSGTETAGEGTNTTPTIPSEVGTTVVAETTNEVQTPPSETPKSPTEVETKDDDSHAGKADVERVIIGYHPVTEKPVYLDEQ